MSKAKIKEQAAEIMKEHKYTCLAKTEKLEAWRCMQDGTSIYAFDILITRFGIAIVGDIDFLTFRVGLNYGIPFLAGRDVGYYIHSKLEHKCRETTYDLEGFEFEVKENLALWFEGNWENVSDYFKINTGVKIYEVPPSWVFDSQKCEKQSMKKIVALLKGLKKLFEKHNQLFPEVLHEVYLNLISSAPDEEQEAYEWLSETFEGMDINGSNLLKKSPELMQRLYMVNHAAKEIMKIREASNV